VSATAKKGCLTAEGLRVLPGFCERPQSAFQGVVYSKSAELRLAERVESHLTFAPGAAALW
jgi:hypothetical protein